MPLSLLPWLLAWPLVASQEEPSALAAELRPFDLVDNGAFDQVHEGGDPVLARRIPWWRTRGPRGLVEREERDGAWWLVTSGGESASQPLAAYAPAVERLVVQGFVRGRGILSVLDGLGGRASFEVGVPGDGVHRFAIQGSMVGAELGRTPQPRLELELASSGTAPCSWTGIEALVALPCPGEEVLRAELVARLDAVFGEWLERGRDEGSGLIQHVFDVVDGKRLFAVPGGHFPVFEHLLDALALEEREDWRAGLEEFLGDYLQRGLHPETGLPQKLDGGEPNVSGWVEVAADLGFLLDVAARGPERFREPARAAAVRIGETVLAHGVLPDGTVAAKYRPRDAATSLATTPLRRLDLPAQLARLGAVTGERRYVDAARNALAVYEFTHHWPGDWRRIDPGFDDDYGLYGARALDMLEAFPGDAAFRSLVHSGYLYYAPRWRDALRFGGTVAADQTRCWRIFAGYSRLVPETVPVLRLCYADAVRAHFKSQQYGNGAWGDVTFVDFDPKTGIQVGDLPGAPSNLLQGLGVAYDERFGLRTPELRAMIATLLLSTDAQYRREHGYLLTPREMPDGNRAGGGVRLCEGWLLILASLQR